MIGGGEIGGVLFGIIIFIVLGLVIRYIYRTYKSTPKQDGYSEKTRAGSGLPMFLSGQ